MSPLEGPSPFERAGRTTGHRKRAQQNPNGRLIIDHAAPYQTAKTFLELQFMRDGASTLHHHRGIFYRWNGTAYAESADADLTALGYEFLDSAKTRAGNGELKPVKPNAKTVGHFVHALKAVAKLDDAVSPPAWLPDPVPDLPAHEIIACANGLLHLPSLELIPHTPAFFTHNAVECAFQPDAAQTVGWLEFLHQLWPDDGDSIGMLQELFGYCLTPDTRQQKAFLIVGPKRSGKGTIGRILARVVGLGSTVAPRLATLGTNFGLAPLIGKRVAIISDARLSGRADQHAIAESLLSITGEDAITIDRKYLPAWTGRLNLRFVVISNELPQIADASGALSSRFIVLVLTNSFYGQEDHTLSDRLMLELSGILNWSIEGWRRLRKRGHFLQPASALDTVTDLEDLGSPVRAFIRDRCECAPHRMVEIGALFGAWCDWCKEQGRDHPGNSAVFGRALRAAHPAVRVSQPRDGDERRRFYQAIGLR
jgi:putative DNA primase/helicase